MNKTISIKEKPPGYRPRGIHSCELCQFLYFKRIIWSKNDWAFTPVPASAGASRVNDEDAPNHRVS